MKQKPVGKLTFVKVQLKENQEVGAYFSRLIYIDEAVNLWAHETVTSVHTIEPMKDVPYVSVPPNGRQQILLDAARCALADLEGIMPEFETSGDREHSGWTTIEELKTAIDLIDSGVSKPKEITEPEVQETSIEQYDLEAYKDFIKQQLQDEEITIE